MAKVLICSTDRQIIPSLKNEISFFRQDDITQIEKIDNFLEAPPSDEPTLCLVDARFSENETLEWTQTLKMTYPSAPAIVLYSFQTPLNFAQIKKNGADRLLHFYFDIEFLSDTILELCKLDFGDHPPLEALQTIETSDLTDQMELNFDLFVHLPHNHKTIKLRKKGSTLQNETIQKVSGAGQSLYFCKTEKKQFLEYARTAQTLNNSENPIAGTEKNLKFKIKFFEFMSEFFDNQKVDFETGKRIFDLSQTIIRDYGLLEKNTPLQWKNLVESRTGRERTYYEEALNMALYCSLLADLNEQSEEFRMNLGLVGLFHNIGLSKLTCPGLVGSQLSIDASNLDNYLNYPFTSVEMIKAKKVPLPALVSELIMQHQERPNGQGFPKKLMADALHKDLNYVLVAYEFQKLTSLSPGEEKRTPLAAAQKLLDEALAGTNGLDFTLCKKLVGLLS